MLMSTQESSSSLESLALLESLEELHRRSAVEDFIEYAAEYLKIRTKEGQIKPFALNQAQLYIHDKLETQRKETGRVRALILKGRQQGCSTYTEGRFYWLASNRGGVRAYILTHEQEATNNLFDIAKRYHENDPNKPATRAANAKELDFSDLDSGYRVATAGTKAAGRSQTVQLFHGSEVAFWPHAADHMAGIMQAVPDGLGTEAILESTANGIGNLFHGMWQESEAGLSDYIAVFVPWFWQDEYTKEVGDDFSLDADEADYKDAHSLSDGQMAWRRTKIGELRSLLLFKQEYPATALEAFQVTDTDSFISGDVVTKARKAEADRYGALVVGVDPARFGDDRTSIIRRQGRVAFDLESHAKKDTMQVAGMVRRIIENENPVRVFIDVIGIGAGVVDRLNEMGFSGIVDGVNSAERPMDDERYLNKRAEMWGEMREWLKDQPTKIPNEDSLHADLTGPSYSYDSAGRMKLERKEDMKKRGLRSPDDGDALALTFSVPVSNEAIDLNIDTDWVI